MIRRRPRTTKGSYMIKDAARLLRWATNPLRYRAAFALLDAVHVIAPNSFAGPAFSKDSHRRVAHTAIVGRDVAEIAQCADAAAQAARSKLTEELAGIAAKIFGDPSNLPPGLAEMIAQAMAQSFNPADSDDEADAPFPSAGEGRF